MLGGITPLTTVLGAAPSPDADTLRIKNYAKTVASIGMHLLLIAPYSKVPVDMRSPVQRRTEDTAAQQLAREAGRADWSRVKSKGGVHLATDDAKLLGRYIDRYRKVYESDYDDHAPVNMAVAVGPSRLVIVDCDTEEQVAAFLSDAGIPSDTPLPPTVRSPGQQDADGNWVHYGGGHYYFTLPENVELPAGTGSLTMPGGYAILWDGRYVLIPPSIREEGSYVLAGQDYEVPDWIVNAIRTHAAGRGDRRVPLGEDAGELAANIDAWAELVSWDDLLEPAGWMIAARPDGCGCQVWTAPGVHASPKSATAHDTGCSYGRYSEVNAPLHIWTDNPPDELAAWIAEHGTKTITKLQFVALTSYNGDVGTACAELGMIPKDDLSLDTSGMVLDLGLSASNLDEPMTMDPPQTNPNVRPSLESLKSPAVDIERERALARVAAQKVQVNTAEQPVPERAKETAQEFVPPVADPPPFGTPYGQPVCIPVRPGDVWRNEYEDMLVAEGFTEHDSANGRIEFSSANPDDDRVLRVEFEPSTMVVTALTISGEPMPLISLTPLRSTLPVSGQPVPERAKEATQNSGLSIGFSDPANGVPWGTLPDGSIVTGHDVPEQNDSVDEARELARQIAELQRIGQYTYRVTADGVGLLSAVESELQKQDPWQYRANESVSGQPVPEQCQHTNREPDTGICTVCGDDYPGVWAGMPYVSGQPVPEQTSTTETFSDPGTPTDPPVDPPQFNEPGEQPEDGVLETGDQFMPRIALFDYWRDIPPPEFVVDGILERGGMAGIIGPAGKGKTAVLLDMISCIATGQRWHGRATTQMRGIYLPGEGMSGAVQRLIAWEHAHKANIGTSIAVGESILRAAAPKSSWERLVQLILQNQMGFLVFDTWARMAVGIEENSATEVGKVIARLDEVRKLTGVTVIVLHHTTKGSVSGRGSSALNGALDTEILVTDELWCDDEDNMPPGKQLTVRVTKQKNAAEVQEGIPLLMKPYEDSIVITGPSGEIGDVFDEISVTRAILPEPSMDTAARIAKALEDFTTQGLTVSEAAQAVPADEWTARRGDAAKAWKLAIRRAIDLGMRFQLFETLSGNPTGSRYIRSVSTVAAFRDQVISAGLSE